MNKFFRTLLAFIAILTIVSTAIGPGLVLADSGIKDSGVLPVKNLKEQIKINHKPSLDPVKIIEQPAPVLVVEPVLVEPEPVVEPVMEKQAVTPDELLSGSVINSMPSGTTILPKLRASIKYDNSFTWDILKTRTSPTGPIILPIGETIPLNYEVIVTATSGVSMITISGNLAVQNTGLLATEGLYLDVEVVGVSGTFLSVTPAQLAPRVPGDPPIPGGTFVLPFSFTFAGDPTATYHVVAHATITNYEGQSGAYGPAITPVLLTVTPGSVVDECVTVSDSLFGLLGPMCANESPKTFTYSLTAGPYLVCGDYQKVNTASFVTTDTQTSGFSIVTTDINVPCEPPPPPDACTLTPGYWKTHSTYGPASYDPIWASIGEDTIFFRNGKTYYQALWTNPTGGNAYYILAHAYIAAVLNGFAGADAPDAQMAFALAFFELHTPTEVLSRADRQAAIAAAGVLDSFNNGFLGFPHCD